MWSVVWYQSNKIGTTNHQDSLDRDRMNQLEEQKVGLYFQTAGWGSGTQQGGPGGKLS